MKTKQLICNDCGCRFEIKDAREHAPLANGTKKPRDDKREAKSLSCPECRSYNLTTA